MKCIQYAHDLLYRHVRNSNASSLVLQKSIDLIKHINIFELRKQNYKRKIHSHM